MCIRDRIGSLGDKFGEFVEWAKWVGGVTAMLGGLMIGLKLFIGIMKAVNLVMAANPMVLMAVTAAGLAAGIVYLTNKYWDAIEPFAKFAAALAKGAAMIAGFILVAKTLTTVFTVLGAVMAATPIGILVAGFAAGAAAIITYWEPLTDFFSNLFNGIADMYNNVVGDIASGLSDVTASVGGFFGFGDEDKSPQLTTEETASPQQRAQVAMSETISRTISESRETVDINVTGQNGAQVSSLTQSSRLNLINTAN